MSRLLCVWCFLVIGCLVWPKVSAETFPAPPKSTVELVSSDAQSMGMSLSIRKFTTKTAMKPIIEFYQKRWQDQAIVSTMGPWTMVGYRRLGKFYNVQMQAKNNQTWGYLSVSNLPERLDSGNYKIHQPNVFPAMGNSKVLDHQQHTDLLNHSKTTLLSNKFSVDANSSFYINHFTSRRWQLSQNSEKLLKGARVLTFDKGRQSLSLTLERKSGTTFIVSNLTKKRTLRD